MEKENIEKIMEEYRSEMQKLENANQEKEFETNKKKLHIERLEDEIKDIDPISEKTLYEEYKKQIDDAKIELEDFIKETRTQDEIYNEKKEKEIKVMDTKNCAIKKLTQVNMDIDKAIKEAKLKHANVLYEIDNFKLKYDENHIALNGNQRRELFDYTHKIIDRINDLNEAKTKCEEYLVELKQPSKEVETINSILNGTYDSKLKTEPAKTEPAKTEPAKTEPAKTEPAKTEPIKDIKYKFKNITGSKIGKRAKNITLSISDDGIPTYTIEYADGTNHNVIIDVGLKNKNDENNTHYHINTYKARKQDIINGFLLTRKDEKNVMKKMDPFLLGELCKDDISNLINAIREDKDVKEETGIDIKYDIKNIKQVKSKKCERIFKKIARNAKKIQGIKVEKNPFFLKKWFDTLTIKGKLLLAEQKSAKELKRLEERATSKIGDERDEFIEKYKSVKPLKPINPINPIKPEAQRFAEKSLKSAKEIFSNQLTNDQKGSEKAPEGLSERIKEVKSEIKSQKEEQSR